LIAWASTNDESTFGDRIVPRATDRQQETKSVRSQPFQQLIVTSPPIPREERRNEFNNKEIFDFFAPESDPKPTTYRPIETRWNVNTPSSRQTITPTEPTVSYNQDQQKNINTEQDYSRSNKDQDSISAKINSLNNNNDGLQVEHKSADSPLPPSSTISQSNPPKSSFSFYELGSNSRPENLGGVPAPFVESEQAGKEAGSPGSVSSFIDNLHTKLSPFSLQEMFSSSDFSTPLTTVENTAERPIISKAREIETFKSPFSQEIAPLVQSVSSEPPTFVPSPPFETMNEDFLPSRYPELRPPGRQLNFKSSTLPASTESIAPFSQPKFPEPNRYAGFLPQPLSGPGDSFTKFPKPNFPAFPPPSTKTVYFGGNPNEPPTHLQNNVVNFIKSKAVSEGEFIKAPNTFSSDSGFYPGNFPSSFLHFKTISNAQLGLQKQTHFAGPPVSKVNVQTIRSPSPSHFVNLGPSPPKTNFPSAATKPISGFSSQSNAKQTVSFNNVGTPPRQPSSSSVLHTEINKIHATPKPFSTLPNTNNKPSRFVASPLLSYTKPLVPASPMPLARPVRVPQHQLNPPQRFLSGNQPSGHSGSTSGWIDYNPFTGRPVRSHSGASSGSFSPSKNQSPITISPQVRQVLPSLTRNPARVPILAPVPVFLQPGSVTLPQSPSSKTYSIPLEKPVYYHAYVSYG
jgi:hypothetical protein